MIEPLSAAKTLVKVLSMRSYLPSCTKNATRESRLSRHLADSSFQVSFSQGKAAICLKQRCRCTCKICVTLTSGGIKRLVLLELTIRHPGCFRLDLYILLSNSNHLLEFINSVVNALHLHLDLGLQLVHGNFGGAHFAPRLTNLGFAASTIEEVVVE